MIPLHIYLDQPLAFDRIIQSSGEHPTLPEGGDLSCITKHDGTLSGAAIAMLTFTCQVKGETYTAQAVTSIKLLKGLLRVLDAKYDEEGLPRAPGAPA